MPHNSRKATKYHSGKRMKVHRVLSESNPMRKQAYKDKQRRGPQQINKVAHYRSLMMAQHDNSRHRWYANASQTQNKLDNLLKTSKELKAQRKEKKDRAKGRNVLKSGVLEQKLPKDIIRHHIEPYFKKK